MPRRGRPCGPVRMLELATVPRALFIRPNASSPGYPALPVATSQALLCRHFECLVGNRVSAALSFMLLLIRRCRCRNFHSSYTVLIAPRTRLHRVHFDIVEFLASMNSKLLPQTGYSNIEEIANVPCEAGHRPQQGTTSGPSRSGEGPTGCPCRTSWTQPSPTF